MQIAFLDMLFRKLACGEFSQDASGKASRPVDLLLWILGPLSYPFLRVDFCILTESIEW